MKKWKKIGMLLTAATAALAMSAGCACNKGGSTLTFEQGQSDLKYVRSKGTLTVGITDFAPMDYRDGENWAGFDADLAKGFAESIGVALEFVEIDWNKKTELLEKGSIDCVWNGMTKTEELEKTISCTEAYLSNAQVIVFQNNYLEKYNTSAACQHLLFAVEAGSTGETLLKQMKYRYNTFPTQLEALRSVAEKKSDAVVIDIIMASYYTETGQEFESLGFNISLNDESICAGFRKNSDLTEKANEFIKASYENGTINSLAKQYGIESAVLD